MDQGKIGRFISARRREAGLTQAALADRLGVSDRAVSKWENGRSLPDASIMLELCALLNISVNELLSGERLEGDAYRARAEANLLALLERGMYRSAAAPAITFEEFQNALLRFAEAAELMRGFATKEEAVDYLAWETQCPREECARAYDVYVGMGEG